MTNRSEANKLASKITGETVNASTTKGALEAISGKKAGSIAKAINDIAQGDIPSGDVTVEELNVTENGTYIAPEGKAYSPVTVNVAGGGGVEKLLCWRNDENRIYTTTENPQTGDKIFYMYESHGYLFLSNSITIGSGAEVTENGIYVNAEGIDNTFARDSQFDLSLV